MSQGTLHDGHPHNHLRGPQNEKETAVLCKKTNKQKKPSTTTA